MEALVLTRCQQMINGDFWSGKRVLVTGHTGFKGAWLCIWLRELGALVSGFSLKPTTSPALYDLAKLGETITSHMGDIRSEAAIRQVIRTAEPEILIHMAAQPLVRASYADPVTTYATNVMGTVHVLEAAREVESVKVVINVTSDKCYENREWVWAYRESDAMGGMTPIVVAKGVQNWLRAPIGARFSPIQGLHSRQLDPAMSLVAVTGLQGASCPISCVR